MLSVCSNLTIRLLAIATIITLVRCASAPERKAVPFELTSEVSIPGVPEARFWGDEWPKFGLERFNTFSDADFQKFFSAMYDTTHNYLAISGGGPNGGFWCRIAYRLDKSRNTS